MHVHVAVLVDLGLQPRGRNRERLVAASGERSEQPARVPGAGRAEHSDAQALRHRVNERSSTSGASPPP